MNQPKPAWISYELPLNERIRTFMRLEHLFDRFARHRSGTDPWDNRAAINSLLEIMAIIGRGDLRSEVLKEMDRQAQTLARLSSRKDIDSARLDNILVSLERIKQALNSSENQLGRKIRENEFLSAIRQRNSIPGGTCGFDLPSLQNWLLTDPELRHRDMTAWHDSLAPLEKGIRIVLMLLRESAAPREELAVGGNFQYSLNSQNSFQLVRVMVESSRNIFPEISGGKHRFSIRFMTQPDIEQRPMPTTDDIPFRLVCCLL